MDVYNELGPGLLESVYEVHIKQLRTYLQLLNKSVGWLFNFGEGNFADGMIKVVNRYFHQD